MKIIPGEFHHWLVAADIDKKINNVVRKTHIERRISLLKVVKIGKQFQEKVIELADVGVQNVS